MVGACGNASSAPDARYPDTGLALLGLDGGELHSAAAIGSDPVAVTVSTDGRMAYVADSSPGDVYAVRLPELTVAWKQHVGGAPFGLLVAAGRLYVSLFDAAAVVELDLAGGAELASHVVSQSPAVMTLDPAGRVVVASHDGHVERLDGTSIAAGDGYGIALSGGTLWTADYTRSQLVPLDDGGPVGLPLPVHPFWVAPGARDTLLVAAEGTAEDSDPGAVFSYDPMSAAFQVLARPRDPDEVLQSGPTVLVAAHGDRAVLAIRGNASSRWAQGASAVALAVDAPLGLLVVALNTHE